MTDKPKAVAVSIGRDNPIKRMWSYVAKKNNNNVPKDVKQDAAQNTPQDANPNKKPRRLLGKSVRFWLVIIIMIALIGCGTFAWRSNLFGKKESKTTQQKGKIVFKIEGKEYRETEVNKYTGFLTKYKNEPEEQAVKELFELLKYKSTAEKLGIKPSDTNIKYARNALDKQYNVYINFDEYKKWAELNAFNNVVEQSLSTFSEDTGYKGYSFIFWFGDRLSYTPDYTPPGGYGDQKMIETDRNYAKQRADYYHDQVANNKITAEQAVKEIKQDPKLGFQNIAGFNKSVRFGDNYSEAWETQVYYKSVIDYIKKNENSGVSKVQTGKASVVKSPNAQREETETFYFFVKTEGKSSVSKQKFEDTQKSLKTEYIGLQNK